VIADHENTDHTVDRLQPAGAVDHPRDTGLPQDRPTAGSGKYSGIAIRATTHDHDGGLR
jgi:hypothetical protein